MNGTQERTTDDGGLEANEYGTYVVQPALDDEDEDEDEAEEAEADG